jgi:hypothetical protein
VRVTLFGVMGWWYVLFELRRMLFTEMLLVHGMASMKFSLISFFSFHFSFGPSCDGVNSMVRISMDLMGVWKWNEDQT